MGTPPWEEINDSLSRAAFPYRFVAPQGLSLVEPLILEVYNVETSEEVPLRELSAGEMSLMRFFLFGFAAGKMDDEPKLFLLDEPDSHLHATLIQSFTNGIHEILVNKFGYRVIMTTHRTETIAFTPDDCIFEMHRHGQRIRKSPSKPHTIDLLSNNLIALVANRRPIFVEDKDDADFYNLAMQIMLEDGHWNLNEARPHFIPASTGKGASSRPVGATGVRQWVRRFRDVVEVTRGLVDRDKSNKEEPGLIVLDRHELENYVVDPINIYIFLAAATNSPLVARVGIPVARGREADLGQRSSSELQVIADAVLQALQDRLSPAPSAAECEGVTVEFVNGRSIEVPRWLIERGGKELIGCAKGEWPSIQRGALQEAFARARLVPCSLRKVLKRCVSHEVPDMPAHQACQDSCRIEAPTGS